MKLLIDTNIILEILLAQQNSNSAQQLLSRTKEFKFFISDFSLNSIGVLLYRKKRHEAFTFFLSDIVDSIGITVIGLTSNELKKLNAIALQQNLDFDDSYQYSLSEIHDLTLVSFDADFDKTELGRKTPSQVLSLL